MTSFREIFTKAHKSKTELNSDALYKYAENLEKTVKDRISECQKLAKKGKTYCGEGSIEELIIDTPCMISSNDDVTQLKSSSGYKKLHELCAAPEFDMKIEIANRDLFHDGCGTLPCTVITMNKPYSESPDAGIHLQKDAKPSHPPVIRW